MQLLFFSTDILINFRTAIIDDGELIQAPWPVASKYLRGWFVLDLVATIPYELLLTALFPSTFNSKALAWAQLPRFVRFLRLVRERVLHRSCAPGTVSCCLFPSADPLHAHDPRAEVTETCGTPSRDRRVRKPCGEAR